METSYIIIIYGTQNCSVKMDFKNVESVET